MSEPHITQGTAAVGGDPPTLPPDLPSPILTGPLGRGVLRFGAPMAAAMAAHASFNLIDLVIIGNLPNGTAALGALAVADMLAMLATILVLGLSNATVAVIARRLGRGDRDGANEAAWGSIGLILALSVGLGIVGVFGADWVTTELVGTKGEIRTVAIDYLQIIVGGSGSIFFLLQLTAIMRGLGESRFPSIIIAAASVLNIVLDVIMAYGPGPAPAAIAWATPFAVWLGVPHMGVNGAAWATVIARVLGSIVALIWLLGRHSGLSFKARLLIPPRAEVWRLVKIAAPSSAQLVVRILAVIVFVSLVARFFTTETDGTALAAFGICIRLDTIALFSSLGWGAAASTFVGQNLGAGRPDRALRAGWIAAGYTVVAMLAVAALYVTGAGPIVGFFDDTPEVVAIGREYLAIVGPSYAFLGVAAVLSSALSGAGATLSSFVLDLIVVFGIQIPVGILLIGQGIVGRPGAWWILATSNLVSALIYAYWYSRRGWLQKQI